MPELDIVFYRKASSISISVFSLGLFGDVRKHWSQPRVLCTLVVQHEEGICAASTVVCSLWSLLHCGTAEVSSWVLGRFLF